MTVVGLVAPGAMGAAVGACLSAAGSEVRWASQGRSDATRERAEAAGLTDVGSLTALCRDVEVLVCVCPPHAAVVTAEQVAAAGFRGTYLDANAIAPATAARIAALVAPASYLDGGLIGGPPQLRQPSPDAEEITTRLVLSGPRHAAEAVAGLVDPRCGSLAAVVLDGELTAASALKVAFAAWTKGSSALLFAVHAYAQAAGVDAALVDTWRWALPDLEDRVHRTAPGIAGKAWRWVSEMEQISEAFRAAGLPGELHTGAAEVYARLAPLQHEAPADLASVLASLLAADDAEAAVAGDAEAAADDAEAAAVDGR